MIEIGKRNPLLAQYRISSLSFSVAVVLVQLYKYSSYLSDAVVINIRYPIAGKLKIFSFKYFPAKYQTFLSLCRKVSNDLRAITQETDPGTRQEIELQWFPEQAKNEKEIYLCKLFPGTGMEYFEARFINIRHGFYEMVFHKADNHYKILAERLIQNQLTSVEKIDFLKKVDFEEIESLAYGPADATISHPELLHQLFEQAAGRYADRPAIIYKERSLTFRELNIQANRLADILIRNGIKKGDFVGILLNRCPYLYVAMLAALKSGAAYVPMDLIYPEERIKYILHDSGAKILLTGSDPSIRIPDASCQVLNVEKVLMDPSVTDLPCNDHCLPQDVQSTAYLIYTSGSTGKPKGVVVSHSAISNLVKAEKELYQLRPEDRILQGFSPAFDASLEEIWISFLSGSSLYPADETTMVSATEVGEFINNNNISVFSTVPTLLSMMQPPMHSLRLLILGGENCPHDLLNRWHSESLRIVNTYGPTEAAVVTTSAEFTPGEKITIGRPLSNYAVFITDKNLKPVLPGVPGEICISGPGLASGYLNQQDLTDAKFISPGFPLRPGFENRLYRSGDLGRFGENGNVEFLGRIDSQVKLRGYRIELAEIESQLLEIENIRNAVVAVKVDKNQIEHLVAYLVLGNNNHAAFNEDHCKDVLKRKMAVYMIPSAFVILENLPLLPNGKVDRKSLPEPDKMNISNTRQIIEPSNEIQLIIHNVWKEYFHHLQVSVTDNFFLDLGGHSLLAARVISKLRQNKVFEELSIKDLYQFPTIEKLAAVIEASGKNRINGNVNSRVKAARYVPGRTRHFVAGLVQFLSLYFILGYNLFLGIIEFFVFFYFYDQNYSFLVSISLSLASIIISYPALILVAILVKWSLLGRLKPGRHKLWSWFYIRWWFVQNIVHALHLDFLEGTTILPFIYRMLGMKVGKNVHIETDRFGAFDLISIGDRSSINEDASILGYGVKNGYLALKPTVIGQNCFIGARSVLAEGAKMENGARITDLSMVPADQVIPENETWEGSPVQFISRQKTGIEPQYPSRRQKAVVTILYAIFTFVLPMISFIAFIPGIIILKEINPFDHFIYFIAILPVVGLSFVVLFTLEILFLKRVFIGKLKPGVYPVHGSNYLKHWVLNHLLRMSINNVGQLHATLHIIPWCRALGIKLGKLVELSTASLTNPDLITLDDGCTIADEVSLGSPHIEGGWLNVSPIRLGSRTFVGNSAVIPTGTETGKNSLIGVLSIAPSPEKSRPGNSTWFGSPAILFPKREPSDGFTEEKTYSPSKKLRIARWLFELLRISLPPCGFVFVNVSVIVAAFNLYPEIGIFLTMLLLPVVLLVSCATVTLAVVLIKWIVIGKYKPFNHPLWSHFVWRLELVNALYEFMAAPLFLGTLQGTPFLSWYLRLLGAKIGDRCYLNTTGFLEWDLVNIGDRAALCNRSVVQTHLFEDRVLKASGLRIGDDCTIGPSSVVLYDTNMGDGASIGSLSLLMKGESIPKGSYWAGCPAKFAGNELHIS